MKGIKGERKCYGMKSPFHNAFIRAGIQYQGTRSTNGYQKAPWYIYGTQPAAEQPDLTELFDHLLNTGWKIRDDLDGKRLPFPETGKARGDQAYESYQLECYHQGVLRTLHIVKHTYAKKPAKDYISLNEITYPG